MKTLHISQLDIRRSSDSLSEQYRLNTAQSSNKESERLDTNPIEVDVLIDLIEELQEKQKLHKKLQQWPEAQELEDNIKKLKTDVVVKKYKELEQTHKEEVQTTVKAQVAEVDSFHKDWDMKINSYDAEAKVVEDMLLEKQKEDLAEMKRNLEETLPLRPKMSSQHLNYRKMMDTLAKQGKYDQAGKLRVLCIKYEKDESAKAKEEKDNKIKASLTQLKNKKKNELNVLKKKVQTGKTDLTKVKAEEFEKLLHKCQNLRQEIEIAQQLEISKFQLEYKNYVSDQTLSFLNARKTPKRFDKEALPTLIYTNTVSSIDFYKSAVNKVVTPKRNSITPKKIGYHSGRSMTDYSTLEPRLLSRKVLA